MAEDPSMNDAEQDIRRATQLKNKAESGAEDLTEDDVNDLYDLVEEGYDSWKVTYSALNALNAIAKTFPALLTEIIPHLIQNHLSLPSEYDDEFVYEDVSTDPEIGKPVQTSWILHNVTKQDPKLLFPHIDLLTKLYQSDTTQPHYFLLVLGRLAIADPDCLPVKSIRTDLQELLNKDDSYAPETEEILAQLE